MNITGLVAILNLVNAAITAFAETRGLTYEQAVALADQKEKEFFEINQQRIDHLEEKLNGGPASQPAT